MAVLWNRGGLLAPIMYAVALPLGAALAPIYPWPARWLGEARWDLLLGILLGAYGVWRFGTFLNDEEADPHRLLGVRMETWGLLGLAGALLLGMGWLVTAIMDPGSRPDAAAVPYATPGENSTAPLDYQLAAVARAGSDPGRWLFEVSDQRGVRHTLKLGEQLDRWTLAGCTNGFLVLQEIGSERRLPLRVPTEP